MAQALSSQMELFGNGTKKNFSRRSTFETRMDVLKVIAEGYNRPTLIMYRSNTSWVALQRNLRSLMAAGFLNQTNNGSRAEYTITDSGVHTLQTYQGLLAQIMIDAAMRSSEQGQATSTRAVSAPS